jgi:hypothetical protein
MLHEMRVTAAGVSAAGNHSVMLPAQLAGRGFAIPRAHPLDRSRSAV